MQFFWRICAQTPAIEITYRTHYAAAAAAAATVTIIMVVIIIIITVVIIHLFAQCHIVGLMCK